jgi:ribosomal-protein-alanine N-acetyltransferase
MTDPEEAIQSDRFVLEPLLVGHADLLFDDLLHPRLYDYVPSDPPASREALRLTYERWVRRRSADGAEVWYNYALKALRGAVYVGTLQATLRPEGDSLIAYQVFPRFWRTGIATEGVSAMMHALAAGGVTRFVAQVDTRNVASQRLLASLGFALVRRIDEADFFKGARSDEFEYERVMTGLH